VLVVVHLQLVLRVQLRRPMPLLYLHVPLGYTGVLVLHVLSVLSVPLVLLRNVSSLCSARTARAAVVHVMTALHVRFC
jgi:hypothetical protein